MAKLVYGGRRPTVEKGELRRYTSLASALHILSTSTLTLLSPSAWEDKNDVFQMDRYRDKAAVGSVVALCFAGATETHHHWKVFAPGADGVCLVFKRSAIIPQLEATQDLRSGWIEYKTLDALKKAPPSLDQMPFIKRYGFRAEQEFRVLYASAQGGVVSHAVPIDLQALDRVVLSPWLATSLFDVVRNAIKNARGDSIKVVRSVMINSLEFQRALGARET